MNKTTVVIILLLFGLLCSLVFVSSKTAYALGDPMTLSQIASLTYGLGNSFGLDFAMSGITATGANDFFSNEIDSWLSGRSISEVFGVTPAQIIAGKLVIPHLLYNGIREFLQSFVTEKEIGPATKEIVFAVGDYQFFALQNLVDPNNSNEAAAWSVVNTVTGRTDIVHSGYYLPTAARRPVNQGISYENNYVYGLWNQGGGSIQKFPLKDVTGQSMTSVGASLAGSIPETVLNPDEEWTGLIGGQDWPDTNLDELLGQIDQDVADNNLEVEGEVTPVVPPTPAPTPAPIDPDTPLQNVPWEGLNDLIGQKTDTIGEGIRDQTDAITGAQEATTEAVESLTETIEGALDTPSTEELPQFKFDLRELFPFCIPFDIYRLLSSFDAEPIAPHVQIPFVIQSLGFRYDIDLDFSVFDPVAETLRTVEFIVYALGLAWATEKVIKW